MTGQVVQQSGLEGAGGELDWRRLLALGSSYSLAEFYVWLKLVTDFARGI